MTDSKSATVKIRCDECGGGYRNHDILAEHEKTDEDEDIGIWVTRKFQICKCVGCDTVRFRCEARSSEDVDYETGQMNASISIYPEVKPNARQSLKMDDLPDRVSRIYRETVKAFNEGAFTLAGGGLRAIVEAVCIENNVKGKNLEQRIDKLADQGLLAKTQAQLLHEERYLGNSALHEIETPAQTEIEDGLQIVETLLNAIYIAPIKAERLKKGRLKKAAAKLPTKGT